jgi:hypothetical protein
MEDDLMEYFLLEHPPDRLILCTRSGCERIADNLEVNEQGGEDFVCAAHTSSEGMLQFCQRVYPVPIRTGADLSPAPCSASLELVS